MVDDDITGGADQSQGEKETETQRDQLGLGDGDVSTTHVGVVPPEEPPPEVKQPAHKWTWAVVFLCFYGFMTSIKPGEPFITPYLLSPEKNFTREQVTNEITPVLSYSYMAVLVPAFLLTDFLRYKPVLVIQGASQVVVWVILLLGSGLLEMQFMEFFYGITMACRVAYSSYIFSLVSPDMYQRVAGYSRCALLLGVFTSSVLGQLCLSLGHVSFYTLSSISLGFVSFGLLLALLLPWPKRSLFFNRAARNQEHKGAPAGSTASELDRMNPKEDVVMSSSSSLAAPPVDRTKIQEHKEISELDRMNPKENVGASSGWRSSVLVQMMLEVREAVRKPGLRLWCLWWVFNSTGYYLVLFYVHILWNKVDLPSENKHVYNGAVEAASTLLSAITSFLAGYVKIRWRVWSELLIGLITAVHAALLLLMWTTTNIWVCYAAYVLFRGFYQFLVPIATFQIASSLNKELCALVFGINTFLGTILKTIIILIIADKRGLALDVKNQFLVYFFYFALLTVVYLISAAVVIFRHHRNQPTGEKRGGANELAETETLSNGTDNVKV